MIFKFNKNLLKRNLSLEIVNYTGEDQEWLHFHFGQSDPTVVVWGMRFLKPQVSYRGTLSLREVFKNSSSIDYWNNPLSGWVGGTAGPLKKNLKKKTYM